MKTVCAILSPFLKKDLSKAEIHYKREEAVNLAQAIKLDIQYVEDIPLRAITPASFIGKGVIERIKQEFESFDNPVELVYVDTHLSPVQQRNLERAFKTKVIDRVGLILEIFGARAQTREGQLQVELAALEYQKSRLVRSWTHLERQRGGAGFMGGPGERQIEIDRRLISERITMLKKDLDKVRQNRHLQKRNRDKVPFPIVALVGYTNAGKSTLFNQLTDSKIMAKDMLFATLDTTMRKLTLPNNKEVLLSDTVGFISDLPTHLIAAFRATLEQLDYADIILHVKDAASSAMQEQEKDVYEILEGFNLTRDTDRVIEVYNKIDLLEDEQKEQNLRYLRADKDIAVSALTGEGSDQLLQLIADRLTQSHTVIKIKTDIKNGSFISWLHENSYIIDEDYKEEEATFTIRIGAAAIGRLHHHYEGEFQRL